MKNNNKIIAGRYYKSDRGAIPRLEWTKYLDGKGHKVSKSILSFGDGIYIEWEGSNKRWFYSKNCNFEEVKWVEEWKTMYLE